jgi:diadenosine tetraphosphatase ApaH/serine/threonine PP2A family protein phosphatase
MRFAIFGDIHANLEALQRVLDDAEEQQCTHYICMGDIVGYNANPKECLDLVREMECPTVKGNHDEQVAISDPLEGFNPLASEALMWTRNQLEEEDKQWLDNLPFIKNIRDFSIVHATLDTPHRWGYVFNQLDATASFTYQHTALCFCGHTHIPKVFVSERGDIQTLAFNKVTLTPGRKYFINVGSVGQPRDGDWRAAYTIYHTDQNMVELRRLEYDIKTAQKKIIDHKLPLRLAERLSIGK